MSGELDPVGRLAGLLRGYQVTQLLYVFATLGVADRLADGPLSAGQLAAAVDADADTFIRLLAPLTLLGVLDRDEDGAYRLTALGNLLRKDVPNSMRPAALSYGQPWWWQPWGNLLTSVRTGATAFDETFHEPLFPYLRKHPDAAAVFNANMTAMSATDAAEFADAFSIDDASVVVDVGGGHGTLGAAVLARYPGAQVIVFDQPDVVDGFDAGRLRAVAGDFFTDPPPSADVYILKDVLHDWNDQRCETILRTIRRAAPPHARLLIVERILDPDQSDLGSALVDVTMLVLTGGKERSAAAYAALLTATGWHLTDRLATSASHSVLSARCGPS